LAGTPDVARKTIATREIGQTEFLLHKDGGAWFTGVSALADTRPDPVAENANVAAQIIGGRFDQTTIFTNKGMNEDMGILRSGHIRETLPRHEKSSLSSRQLARRLTGRHRSPTLSHLGDLSADTLEGAQRVSALRESCERAGPLVDSLSTSSSRDHRTSLSVSSD